MNNDFKNDIMDNYLINKKRLQDDVANDNNPLDNDAACQEEDDIPQGLLSFY